MTKTAPLAPKKWPNCAEKAHNKPKIRPELNSLSTGNAMKGKLFVYISIL